MIAIVATLTGLLLPSVVKARRSADGVQCAANLRQWAVAARLYADEWHQFLPRRGQGQQPTGVVNRPSDWFNALPAELRQPTYQDLVTAGHMPTPGGRASGIWCCPTAAAVANASGYLFTYGMNMRLSTWDAPDPDRIDRVGPVSTLAFMADAPGGYCSVLPFNYQRPAGPGLPISPVARHSGRVNIAFLDGHVSGFTAAYVGCDVGDPGRADVRWTVPGSTWAGPVQ